MSKKRLSNGAFSLLFATPQQPLHTHLVAYEKLLPEVVRKLAMAVGWSAETFNTSQQRAAFASVLKDLAQDCSATDAVSLELQTALVVFLDNYYPLAASTDGAQLHSGSRKPCGNDPASISVFKADVAVLLQQLRRNSLVLLALVSAVPTVTEPIVTAHPDVPADFVFWVLRFMAERAVQVRANLSAVQTAPPAAGGIAGSNDPTLRGAFYTFNKGGVALRDGFKVTTLDESDGPKKASAFGFDEEPLDPCEKGADKLASDSYCMFMFCPLHGHIWGKSTACEMFLTYLGFHLIDGAEGRKDVHNVLYRYLNQAPQVMYYDFACSLSEYCLNRAGAFYQETRFFHDVRLYEIVPCN